MRVRYARKVSGDMRATKNKKVNIYAMIIGGTGAISDLTTDALEKLKLPCKVEWLQKLVTMETIKIVKSLL